MKKRFQQGFTLVEIMIVLAILSLIIVAISFVLIGHRERARDANRVMAIAKIGESVNLDIVLNNHKVPLYESVKNDNDWQSFTEMHFGGNAVLKQVAASIHWKKLKFNKKAAEET